MAVVTALFVTLNAIRTVYIMKTTGHLFDVPAWAGGIRTLLGRRGVLRRAFPLYRAYYRSSFHPDEHDNREAVARAKGKYLDGTAQRAERPAASS
jgi:predicted metal-dependent hydrolase